MLLGMKGEKGIYGQGIKGEKGVLGETGPRGLKGNYPITGFIDENFCNAMTINTFFVF